MPILSAASAPFQERQAAAAVVEGNQQDVVEAARTTLHSHLYELLGRSGAKRKCFKFAFQNEWYAVKEARSHDADALEEYNMLLHGDRYAPYVYGTLLVISIS